MKCGMIRMVVVVGMIALVNGLPVWGQYSGGRGTEADPYQIGSVVDWIALGQNTKDYDKCFILIRDIDFGGLEIKPVARDVDSDRNYFQGTGFNGKLDGCGYRLSHFIIDEPYSDYIGLFGYIDYYGYITRLGIENAMIKGRMGVGGICGMNTGTIESCYSATTITGDSYIGGLCGVNDFGGSIAQSYTIGAVTGESWIGGLCGENRGVIHQCYAAGKVEGRQSVGGLCGYSNAMSIPDGFWDIQFSGLTYSAGGMGKTTEAMQSSDLFIAAGWDYSDSEGDPADWKMMGVWYPVLMWEQIELTLVPQVVGMTQSEAQEVLSAAGLTVRKVSEVFGDTVDPGKIGGQYPSAGVSIPRGRGIEIQIVLGLPNDGGDGTAENPYRIATVPHWLALVRDSGLWDSHFLLTDNIDFGGATLVPVAPNIDFTGVFDGGGHVLSNFIIDQPLGNRIGLFDTIGFGGRVENLVSYQ